LREQAIDLVGRGGECLLNSRREADAPSDLFRFNADDKEPVEQFIQLFEQGRT